MRAAGSGLLPRTPLPTGAGGRGEFHTHTLPRAVPAGQARARRAGSGALGGSRQSRAGPEGGPKPASISQPKPPAPLGRAASLPPSRLPLTRGPAERFPPLTLLRPNGGPARRGAAGRGRKGGGNPSAHLRLLLRGGGAARSAVRRRRARSGGVAELRPLPAPDPGGYRCVPRWEAAPLLLLLLFLLAAPVPIPLRLPLPRGHGGEVGAEGGNAGRRPGGSPACPRSWRGHLGGLR